MAGSTQTVSEYITHHLTNLTYGELPGGFEREDGAIIGEGGAWVFASRFLKCLIVKKQTRQRTHRCFTS